MSGFHQSFESHRDIPIAQVATAVTLESGKTILLVMNEALCFGAVGDLVGDAPSLITLH